jgi:hypothetical protein
MVRSSPLGKYHIRATADNRPFESEAAACQGGAALGRDNHAGLAEHIGASRCGAHVLDS